MGDSEISDVHLVVLEGRAGATRPPRSGMWSFLPDGTSRIWQYLDHQGREFGGITAVNTGDRIRMGPRPALPSLEEFGIQAHLQEIGNREQESADSYAVQLSHTYCVTQIHPPHGQFEWTCEMVVLIVKVVKRRTIVLQLSAGEIENNGCTTVSAVNLSGEEVCSVRTNLDDTEVIALLPTLAKHCGQDERRIRLVFPSGAVAGWQDGSTKLALLFKSGEPLQAMLEPASLHSDFF